MPKTRRRAALLIFLVMIPGPGAMALRAECFEGDCREGTGRSRYDDGSEYAGTWRGGRYDGRGVFHYADGGVYDGEWRAGLRHGPGSHIAPDGTVFSGTFAGDRPSGEGVYTGTDGRRRRVVIKDEKMVPTVRLESEPPADGCQFGEVHYKGRYVGWHRGRKFDAFQPHGYGTMHWPNGSTYTGQWLNGKLHGRGTMIWENGARYVGEWREGKRTGRGSFFWPGGSFYVGQWAENNRHGLGTYRSVEGNIQNGRWREDAFVGK